MSIKYFHLEKSFFFRFTKNTWKNVNEKNINKQKIVIVFKLNFWLLTFDRLLN